jgi:hypothetical protein
MARNEMGDEMQQRLLAIHRRRLNDLYEDYEAAVSQQGQVLDAVSVNRLQRQAEGILGEIEALEAKIAGLAAGAGAGAAGAGLESAAGAEVLIPAVVPELIQLLTTRFSEDDLPGLALAMGVDYELLPAVGKGNKARELVMYAYRRERLGVLVEKGRQRRPDIDWWPFEIT